MDWLFLLRILSIVVWSVLLGVMLPGAWAAVRGRKVRRGDPMRVGIVIVCLVIIGGNLRWLLAPAREDLFISVYILNVIAGCNLIYLARSYGRGPVL